jgi:hypothetical protein
MSCNYNTNTSEEVKLNNLLSKITEIRGSSNKIYIWNGKITSFSLITQIDYLQGRQSLSLEEFIEFNKDKPLFKFFFNEKNIEDLKKVVLPKKVDSSFKTKEKNNINKAYPTGYIKENYQEGLAGVTTEMISLHLSNNKKFDHNRLNDREIFSITNPQKIGFKSELDKRTEILIREIFHTLKDDPNPENYLAVLRNSYVNSSDCIGYRAEKKRCFEVEKKLFRERGAYSQILGSNIEDSLQFSKDDVSAVYQVISKYNLNPNSSGRHIGLSGVKKPFFTLTDTLLADNEEEDKFLKIRHIFHIEGLRDSIYLFDLLLKLGYKNFLIVPLFGVSELSKKVNQTLHLFPNAQVNIISDNDKAGLHEVEKLKTQITKRYFQKRVSFFDSEALFTSGKDLTDNLNNNYQRIQEVFETSFIPFKKESPPVDFTKFAEKELGGTFNDHFEDIYQNRVKNSGKHFIFEGSLGSGKSFSLSSLKPEKGVIKVVLSPLIDLKNDLKKNNIAFKDRKDIDFYDEYSDGNLLITATIQSFTEEFVEFIERHSEIGIKVELFNDESHLFYDIVEDGRRNIEALRNTRNIQIIEFTATAFLLKFLAKANKNIEFVSLPIKRLKFNDIFITETERVLEELIAQLESVNGKSAIFLNDGRKAYYIKKHFEKLGKNVVIYNKTTKKAYSRGLDFSADMVIFTSVAEFGLNIFNSGIDHIFIPDNTMSGAIQFIGRFRDRTDADVHLIYKPNRIYEKDSSKYRISNEENKKRVLELRNSSNYNKNNPKMNKLLREILNLGDMDFRYEIKDTSLKDENVLYIYIWERIFPEFNGDLKSQTLQNRENIFEAIKGLEEELKQNYTNKSVLQYLLYSYVNFQNITIQEPIQKYDKFDFSEVDEEILAVTKNNDIDNLQLSVIEKMLIDENLSISNTVLDVIKRKRKFIESNKEKITRELLSAFGKDDELILKQIQNQKTLDSIDKLIELKAFQLIAEKLGIDLGGNYWQSILLELFKDKGLTNASQLQGFVQNQYKDFSMEIEILKFFNISAKDIRKQYEEHKGNQKILSFVGYFNVSQERRSHLRQYQKLYEFISQDGSSEKLSIAFNGNRISDKNRSLSKKVLNLLNGVQASEVAKESSILQRVLQTVIKFEKKRKEFFKDIDSVEELLDKIARESPT